MIKIYPHKISAVFYLSSCGFTYKAASYYANSRKMRNGEGYRIDSDAVARYVKGRNKSFQKLTEEIPFRKASFKPGSISETVANMLLAGYSNEHIMEYAVKILGKTPYYSRTLVSHMRFKLRARGYKLPQDKTTINPNYRGSHDFWQP